MAEQLSDENEVVSEEFDKDSDAINSVYCDLCKDDDNLIDAVGLCVDCNDYLCSECFHAHRRNRLSKNHVLKKGTSTSKPTKEKQLARCTEHTEEALDWYCTTHQKCICNLCKKIHHRNCLDVKPLNEISQNFLSSDKLKQVKNRLAKVQVDFETKLTKIKDNTALVEKIYTDTLEDVTRSISKIRDEDIKKMKALEVTCDTTVGVIRSVIDEIETVKQTGEEDQAFIVTRKAESQLLDFDERLVSVQKDNNITKYAYVTESPESNTTGIFGQIHVKKDRMNPVKLNEIDVKTLTDKKNCWISSMERLSGNKLVVADHNNKKVKLVDMSSKTIRFELQLDAKPLDVTRTDSKTLAITAYSDQQILFVSASDTLAVQKTMEKREFSYCQGIVCTNDTLVVSYLDPNQIQIMNMDGTVKQVIEDEDVHGNVRFGCVYYVTQGPDTNILYVSDGTNHALSTMTLDGEVIADFTHEHLTNPRGVSVGSDGRVFLCSEATNTIFELSSDLSQGQVILEEKDWISQPYSVTYDENESKLYVGSRDKNTIQIFFV